MQLYNYSYQKISFIQILHKYNVSRNGLKMAIYIEHITPFLLGKLQMRPAWKIFTNQELSGRLASLGIMGEQLRAPLNMIVL